MAPTVTSRDPPAHIMTTAITSRDPPVHIMTTATTTQLPISTPRHPALSQRPSLRLDTHQVRTFGKGSSLRLDTLSAVSPTARNTFSNAYAPPASAAPATGRPSKLRLSIDSSCNAPSSASTPDSASTLSSALTSASTATSTDSAAIIIPYKQPHNVRSILSNGPTPRKMASSQPLFPAEKRVSFRTPLEEDIKTVKYTLAHSDIDSSVSTISSLTTTSSEESETATTLAINAKSASTASPTLSIPSSSSSSSFASLQTSPRPKGPRTGDKRDSSESDSDSCPETPVAGRRKRRRDWRWTLGPLPSDGSTSTSASTSEATSEDST
ncbi:hypothetical protein PMIN06_002884 [Paraphaeosphaeria minitans]